MDKERRGGRGEFIGKQTQEGGGLFVERTYEHLPMGAFLSKIHLDLASEKPLSGHISNASLERIFCRLRHLDDGFAP
jgi:hypothetical protein